MMQFWIGDTQEYIATEYAKSNRSSCRECKQKIGKDQLRIGFLNDDDHYAYSYWHHLNCFHFKPRHKALRESKIDEIINGIEGLNPADSDKILKDFFESKARKKTKTKKTAKTIKSVDQDESEDQDYQDKPKKSKSKSKKKQKLNQSLSPIEEKTKKIKKTKSKKQPQKKWMTADQTKNMNNFMISIQKCLQMNQRFINKEKNCQAKTGSKTQFAAKCAEDNILGRITSCPKCAGGKPRFDKDKGAYKCPGFMEDTNFKHCEANFAFDELKRIDWID